MGKHCVFILHGSRNFEVQSAVDSLNKQIQQKLAIPSIFCYLTNNNPNLSEALETALSNGASEIICFPLFILPGQHIREDIPKIIDDFKIKHKNCKISLLPSLVENTYFADFLVNALETTNDK